METPILTRGTMRCLGIVLAISCFSTQAAIWEFDLTGPAGNGFQPGNEVPPVSSSATGDEDHAFTPNGGIFFDDSDNTFHFFGNYFNLSSPFQAAHIHGPATTTEEAAPIFTLIHNDQGNSSGFVDAAAPGEGIVLNATQIDQLFDGLWYANIHSQNFPDGELRGQITPTPVPEPETYALMAGMALLGFAGFRRYKAGLASA